MQEILQLLASLRRAHEDALRHARGERFYGSAWAGYGCIILRNRLRRLIEQELRFASAARNSSFGIEGHWST